MAVLTTDLKQYLSGGAANTSGDASIGGAKSTTVASTALDGLYNQFIGAETTAGGDFYRCLYLTNDSGTSTLVNATFWLDEVGANANTTATIGLGAAAKNFSETAVANETTAPVGVTFSAPSTKATGIILPDLLPGEYQAIWVKYTLAAATPAFALDTLSIGFGGDTAA